MIESLDQPRDAAPLGVEGSILLASLDAIPDGVSVQDASGRLIYANAAAVAMIGFSTLDELLTASPDEILARFDLLAVDGTPLSAAELPGRRVLQGEQPEPLVVGYRLRSTGNTRWTQVRATALIGPDGASTHAINTFRDVTEQVRVEGDLRASEASYRQVVEAMPQIAWTTDAAGRVLMVNDRWIEYTGAEITSGGMIETDERIHPQELPELQRRWTASLAAGEPLEMVARLRRRDDVYRWHLVRAVPIRRQDGEIGGWIGTSTDIDDERRAQVAAQLLAAAAEALDESLDRQATARAAAAIAVPTLGDWCAVDLVEPDGSLRREGWASADDIAPLEESQASSPDRPGPTVARAVRDGQSIVEEADGTGLNRLVVPLVARERTLGALTVMTREPGAFRPHHVRLAEELAHRAALSLSNAELYTAEQSARESAEATAARMDLLQTMTRTLGRASSVAEIARIATHDGAAPLGARTAVLVVPDSDDPAVLEMIASHGYDEQTLANVRRLDAGDPLPVARAYRGRTAIWTLDVPSGESDPRLADVRAAGPRAGIAAIPLLVEDRIVGVLGLGFATRRDFEIVDRDLALAQANVVAQAIDRVTLNNAREGLLADLESQRNRLETVLRQMPAGVLIADASGELVLSNAQAGEIWRAPIPPNRHVDDYVEYQGFRPDGTALGADDWPLTRALTTGETITGELVDIARFDGTRAWISVDAAPVRDRDGAIVAAVSTFSDVTADRLAGERQAFLSEASAMLASSLDYEETLARVMRLAVPSVADWAVVNLLDDAGEFDRLIVAHVDPAREELAREHRRRWPPDPEAETGLYAVVRSSRPELVPEIPADAISAIEDEERRRILEELQLRSYMSVPLIAGGETLGVLTLAAAESGRRYDDTDLALAEALAARAAAAIQNAKLFRDVARFKTILDATLDAVLMFDPVTLQIRYVNRGATDLLGWSGEELLGMDARSLGSAFDEARLRQIISGLVEGRVGARTITVTLRRNDGARVPVEVLLQYVEPPGEAGEVVAIARDISDRVESQARLQRLAEAEHARASELNAVIRAMGEGVVVADADGRVVLANPAAEDLFPDIGQSTYPSILARLEDADGRAPAIGERGGPIDLRITGEPERWVEVSTYPVAPRDGRLGGAVPRRGETIVLLRDVTAARQRQAVRDTFIGVLSHELRTPVTTIYAGSKVLARGGMDDEVRRSIFEDIHVEAERLHRLVEDVIALRRFGEEDDSEVGREPVLLQRILPSVLRSEEARWPGVRFELKVPGGIGTVVADPTYVEQVVRNLLSNAAKYGGPGSEVKAVVQSGDGEVLVRILDNGPGFPAEESERLFDLFFRSPSTASAASGAGIGLFVCARLIRAMGGRIWATPRPEGGAEFGFALKAMDEEGL